MEELKPCPFCGGKAKIHRSTDELHPNRWYPGCADRHCLGRNKGKYFPNELQAIKAWNTRKPTIIFCRDCKDHGTSRCSIEDGMNNPTPDDGYCYYGEPDDRRTE